MKADAARWGVEREGGECDRERAATAAVLLAHSLIRSPWLLLCVCASASAALLPFRTGLAEPSGTGGFLPSLSSVQQRLADAWATYEPKLAAAGRNIAPRIKAAGSNALEQLQQVGGQTQLAQTYTRKPHEARLRLQS